MNGPIPPWKKRSFFETLTDAVTDFLDNGYDTVRRLDVWRERLSQASEETANDKSATSELKRRMDAASKQASTPASIKRQHPGLKPHRFSADRLNASMRAEAKRRIDAAVQLIKLNREDAISTTQRRFAGWATSVPDGGLPNVGRLEIKQGIIKPLRQLPFNERRVAIDQANKFAASINSIIASDCGAVAACWCHVHQSGYDGRPEHVARDGLFYGLKDSWAAKEGLINSGEGWYEDLPDPAGTPVFCRCYIKYVYGLRDLPASMLTEKGRAWIEKADEARRMRK